MEIVIDNDEYLMHYGVKGMKWGVRRYRNEDGSYTEEGKKRYRDVPNLKNLRRRKYGLSTKEVAELPRKQRKAYRRWIKDNRADTWLRGENSIRRSAEKKSFGKCKRTSSMVRKSIEKFTIWWMIMSNYAVSGDRRLRTFYSTRRLLV